MIDIVIMLAAMLAVCAVGGILLGLIDRLFDEKEDWYDD